MWITKDKDCKTIRVWKNKPVFYSEYQYKEDEIAYDIWESAEGDDDNVSFVLHETYVNYFEDLDWHEAMEV